MGGVGIVEMEKLEGEDWIKMLLQTSFQDE